MLVLSLLLIAVVSFLSGGINGAIIIARLIYKKDIREYGSGNPGLTNFQRTFGNKAVILVVLIDVLKTAAPVIISGFILSNFEELGSAGGMAAIGRTYAGLFAMLGHAYPAMHGFKGGKTLLAGGTAAFCIDWRVAVIVFGIFLLTAIITRYVSLGGILAALFYPVSMVLWGYRGWPVVLTALSGVLLIYRHKDNIKRLIKGEERKFSFKRK